MAVGWFTILQNVPWSEVINGAPKVADGARKLWNSVTRKWSGAEAAAPADAAAPAPEATLDARVAALENGTAELRAQLVASSELINALAEQNAQLIRRLELDRRRLVWVAAAAIGGCALSITALVWLFLQRGG